jgi:hypothetical protein
VIEKRKPAQRAGLGGFTLLGTLHLMVVLDDDAVTCVGQSTGKGGIGRTAGLPWKPERKPAALLGSYAGWLPRANAGNAANAAKVSPVYVAHSLHLSSATRRTWRDPGC